MSNKAHSKLSPTDRIIRDTITATRNRGIMGEDGTLVKIAFISGFEKFNTRPYHNYETWGDGYRVEGRGVAVEREDLDEAIAAWSLAVWERWTAEGD
jgi:hypothetical protein